MNIDYQVKYKDAIREAKLLLSDNGENPEYDRGVVEIIAYLFDLGDEPTTQVCADLGLSYPEYIPSLVETVEVAASRVHQEIEIYSANELVSGTPIACELMNMASEWADMYPNAKQAYAVVNRYRRELAELAEKSRV
jgi:hypothetical protein